MEYKLVSRINRGCICCGGDSFKKEYGIISPFFSDRVLSLSKPILIDVLLCNKCKSRFFDSDFSDAELGRLYDDYRGDLYFTHRNKYEPWYTKAVNDNVGGEIDFENRRRTFVESLAFARVKNDFSTALDHGGDRGQIFADGIINAKRKAVYEISGVTPDQGIENINRQQMGETSWDLILSCHVLEHITNPSNYIAELSSLGHAGTIYYIEIPNEKYFSFGVNGSRIQKKWLNWLVSHPTMFRAFHFLSIGFRIKLKCILPFQFLALNEHLNFFTVQGINLLLSAHGLEVKYSGIGSSGHIVAVAIKK